MFVLAVDVNQLLADLLEDRQVDRSPIDACHTPSAVVDVAAEDNLPWLVGVGQVMLCQQRVDGMVGRHIAEVEQALDVGLLRAAADELRPHLLAEQRPNRVNDDALARAGLAGERVEAAPQPQPQAVNNRKVGDVQFG